MGDEIVHHIDHNKLNNSFDNLEVLTRSEHARKHCLVVLEDITCKCCGISFHPREADTQYCSLKCKGLASVKNNTIDALELQYDIWRYPYSRLTNKYNLSDVGLKKRAVALLCKIPPPYFHNKTEEYKEALRIKEGI